MVSKQTFYHLNLTATFLMVQFSISALTNPHNLGGLKQQPSVISQFWGSQGRQPGWVSCFTSHQVKIKVFPELPFMMAASGEGPFPAHFRCWQKSANLEAVGPRSLCSRQLKVKGRSQLLKVAPSFSRSFPASLAYGSLAPSSKRAKRSSSCPVASLQPQQWNVLCF